MRKPIMTIVGFGPMGKKFAQLFCSDFDLRVSSSRDVAKEVADAGAVQVRDRHAALASSDYIFLAIPLQALPEMIAGVNAVSNQDAVVIDCCSARVPAEEVCRKLNRRHFGIHDVAKGEYIITGSINEEMTEFFARRGITIHVVRAEEHDRTNAIIGIGHFIGLSLGQLLSENDKAILLGMGSGAKLMALVNHFSETSPATWRETQIDNPFTREQRERLIKALSRYHEALTSGEYPFQQPVSEK